MILWTIQNIEVYKNYIKNYCIKRVDDKLNTDEEFQRAYLWMGNKMKEKGIIPFEENQYPIWMWFQWEGSTDSSFMDSDAYGNENDRMVKFTVEVEKDEVLLSDFDLFHYVLNYWYLPLDEEDENYFEQEYENYGYSWDDLQNFNIKTKSMKYLRKKIVKSWDRIFDIDKEDNNMYYGKYSNKSIQGTLWTLSDKNIKKIELL